MQPLSNEQKASLQALLTRLKPYVPPGYVFTGLDHIGYLTFTKRTQPGDLWRTQPSGTCSRIIYPKLGDTPEYFGEQGEWGSPIRVHNWPIFGELALVSPQLFVVGRPNRGYDPGVLDDECPF